jgi:hypothetical protein
LAQDRLRVHFDESRARFLANLRRSIKETPLEMSH